jgi:predicted lipid carrier protein YhbT
MDHKMNLPSNTFLFNTLQSTAGNVVQKLPTVSKFALKLLPRRVPNKVLELAINNIFKDVLADGELDFLHDKWLEIAVTDLSASWFISLQSNHNNNADETTELIVSTNAPADVTIKGDFNNFILLASNNADPDTLFFNRQLLLTGNTELGLEIKSLLEDFETAALSKHLSKLLHWHSQQILNKTS